MQGPGGKQPASAATNLIGKLGHEELAGSVVWRLYANSGRHSWRRSWHDGGARVPSAWYVLPHPSPKSSWDTVKPAKQTQSRCACSSRGEREHQAYVPYTIPSSPPTSQPKLTNKTRTGTPSRLHQDRRRNRQARDAARAVQRARRGAHGHRAQDGYSLYELRVVQAAAGKQGRNGERAEHVSG